jgi:2-polyprenyl-3-methyl-5-hydroxy-6-metoxy-1,4-benzoquinol methylase
MLRLNRAKVIPVVRLDRRVKAKMIESVLSEHIGCPIEGWSILDIGCGNGDISQYFSRRNQQTGVDITDQRKDANRGFRFSIVEGGEFSCDADSFDIVISNHVIEHVAHQDLHLQEIKRVLKPKGVVYLATPNRSSPFLRGHVGSDLVLRYREMRPLFEKNGYAVVEYTAPMLKEPERFGLSFAIGKFLPKWLLVMLGPVIPSHTFILQSV